MTVGEHFFMTSRVCKVLREVGSMQISGGCVLGRGNSKCKGCNKKVCLEGRGYLE